MATSEEDRIVRRPAGPAGAWLSGALAGGAMVAIGILAAPPPSHQLAIPRPAIEPVCIYLAAALAAAVPAYRRRASLGLTVALALGAALSAYFIGVWVSHWMSVGATRMKTAVVTSMIWRRDVLVSMTAVLTWSAVSTFLAKES